VLVRVVIVRIDADFPFVIFHISIVILQKRPQPLNEKWKMENGK
jgi:hypothetical protein